VFGIGAEGYGMGAEVEAYEYGLEVGVGAICIRGVWDC